MTRRITDEKLQRAIAMRERGDSLAAIASAVDCSTSALSWHFLKHAVDPPKPRPLHTDWHLQCPMLRRGNHVVRAFTPDEDARLTQLALEGLSDSAIGRLLGRKPNSIKGRLMTLARREERALERSAA